MADCIHTHRTTATDDSKEEWRGGWVQPPGATASAADVERLLGAERFSLDRFSAADVKAWAALPADGGSSSSGGGSASTSDGGVNSAAFREMCAARRGSKYQTTPTAGVSQ